MSFFSLINKTLEAIEAANTAIGSRISFCYLNDIYFKDLSNYVDEQFLAASDNNKSWADIAVAVTLKLKKEREHSGLKHVRSQ